MDDHSPITDALRKVRYNEIVHVSIEQEVNHDNTTTTTNSTIEENVEQQTQLTIKHDICLIPCINYQYGGIQFMNLVDVIRNQYNRDHEEDHCTDANGSSNSSSTTLSDDEIILCQELRTKRWFFPMLNDHTRNNVYYDAIVAAIDTFIEMKQQQSVINTTITTTSTENKLQVLDIGSGSGLLSMMVAQYCQQTQLSVHIVSVEMSSAFSMLATRTIQDNDQYIKDSITLYHGIHSTDTSFNSDADTKHTKFDICISELFDDGLFGEGWIPTIRDAWQRHLHPNTIIIPQGATLYASLISASWISNYYGPHPFHFEKDNIPLCTSFGFNSETTTSTKQPLLLNAHHVIVPVHAEKLIKDGSIVLLSDPISIFNIDVTTLDSVPSPKGQSKTVRMVINHKNIVQKNFDGDSMTESAHGVLVWWDMKLWHDTCHTGESKNMVYSMEPGNALWQDHWHPCIYVFDQNIPLTINQDVTLQFRHDDYRLYVEHVSPITSHTTTQNDKNENLSKRLKLNHLASNNDNIFDNESYKSTKPFISPYRAYQLNDTERLRVLQKGIEMALMKSDEQNITIPVVDNKSKALDTTSTLILDVSDFVVGACIAATMISTNAGLRNHKIISLENSSGHLPYLSKQVINPYITSHDVDIDILQCYYENITLDIIGGVPVDVIFAEPYYEILEGYPIQEALNFYAIIRSLRTNRIINDATIVLPSQCKILGCIIECADLQSAYGICGDRNGKPVIQGLDHSYINRIGCRFHEYELSLPLWQYQYKVLSDTFEISRLDYTNSKPAFDPSDEKIVQASFHTTGRADAVLIWQEYFYGQDILNHSLHSNVISTNWKSYNQMVRMLTTSSLRTIDSNNMSRATITCKSTFFDESIDGYNLDIKISLS